MEAPNSKLPTFAKATVGGQAPEKLQTSSLKLLAFAPAAAGRQSYGGRASSNAHPWCLGFVVWNFPGVWSLPARRSLGEGGEFGVSRQGGAFK